MLIRRRTAKGFTLIELLVVIAIIGILASIIMVSLSGAKQKSRDSKRIADIKNIQLALSLYYNDNLFYPKNIYAPSNLIGSSDPANGLAPAYLPTVPTDPSGGTGNCNSTGANSSGTGCYRYNAYTTISSGLCNPTTVLPVLYHIGAAFEDTTNQALTQDSDIAAVVAFPNDQIAFNGTTYYRCSNGTSPSSQFDGQATACVGASAVNPDSCYDLTP